MADKVGGRKQSDNGSSQGFFYENRTSGSDTCVYKSSVKAPADSKDLKQLSVDKSSEEYFEYSCDPCKTASDHAEAQGFCTDCEEYLCGMCFKSHSRSKASKHHNLLDMDAVLKLSRKNCDLCKSDGDEEEAVGYCKDCKEYLCSNCYKSHTRSKSSRYHVLVDKANMPENSVHDISPAFAKMSIPNLSAVCLQDNEECTFIHEMDAHTKSDEKECYITGMTLVPNTALVLCDSYNNSLKLVNTDTCNVVESDSKRNYNNT